MRRAKDNNIRLLDGSLDGPVAPTSGNVNIQVTYVDKAVVLPSATPPMLTDGE